MSEMFTLLQQIALGACNAVSRKCFLKVHQLWGIPPLVGLFLGPRTC